MRALEERSCSRLSGVHAPVPAKRSARGQELASRFDDARLAIEQGRYVDAEVVAQSLVSITELQAASSDSLAARDLLVEALVRNGRGQEPRDSNRWPRRLSRNDG